jgi:hypothetical protein
MPVICYFSDMYSRRAAKQISFFFYFACFFFAFQFHRDISFRNLPRIFRAQLAPCNKFLPPSFRVSAKQNKQTREDCNPLFTRSLRKKIVNVFRVCNPLYQISRTMVAGAL